MNIADLIEFQARTRPDSPALIAGKNTMSYADLDAAVQRLAASFAAQGLAPGDMVGCAFGFLPVHVVIILALARLGAVIVPVPRNGFKTSSAIDITPVPYKASAQALSDVVAGHAEIAITVLNIALPHVRAGRVTALATTDAARGSGPLGDLPTVAETIPGLVLVSWVGIMAPHGTSPEIVTRLNAAIGAALGEPGVRRSIEEGGLGVAYGSPAQFGEIIRSTGIRAE